MPELTAKFWFIDSSRICWLLCLAGTAFLRLPLAWAGARSSEHEIAWGSRLSLSTWSRVRYMYWIYFGVDQNLYPCPIVWWMHMGWLEISECGKRRQAPAFVLALTSLAPLSMIQSQAMNMLSGINPFHLVHYGAFPPTTSIIASIFIHWINFL